MHIVLMGDSILDNAHYLDEQDSVEEILKDTIPNAHITLLAVDGALTSDIHRQLESIPEKPTSVFLSCGSGEFCDETNDLNEIDFTSMESVQEFMADKEKFAVQRHKTKIARSKFRASYASLIDKIAEKCNNIAVFGIYKNVAANKDTPIRSFGLVNEVIMEESARRNIPVINLGALLHKPEDFSTASPIRPSACGGQLCE